MPMRGEAGGTGCQSRLPRRAPPGGDPARPSGESLGAAPVGGARRTLRRELPAHRRRLVRRSARCGSRPRRRRPCATGCPAVASATAARARAGRPLPRARATRLREADIVHAAGARRTGTPPTRRGCKARLGFKLVLTVWETIPFLRAYRNVTHAALPRRGAARDRPVPRRRPSARATSLLLEGVDARADRRSARRASTPSASAPPARRAGRRARDPVPGPAGLGEGPPGRAARGRRAAARRRRRRTAVPAGAHRGPRARGGAAARLRRRARHRRPGRDRRERALRGDARGVRRGLVHGAGGSLPVSGSGRSSSGWCWRRRWRAALPVIVASVAARSRRCSGAGRAVRPRGLARAGARAGRRPAGHAARHARAARPRARRPLRVGAAAERLAAAYVSVLEEPTPR